ncbi:MAG TPA: hypothetical protein PKA64_06820 [Myxococcota bacterium]|nr:hypothetical protein [Myxococcota bacterium]
MWLLLLNLAWSAELVVDAKMPARVSLDGVVVADLYVPGLLRVPTEAGTHELLVTVDGRPHELRVAVHDDTPLLVLVGRSGVTLGETAPAAAVAAAGPWGVRFRVSGRERLLVQVDGQRVVLSPGGGSTLQLGPGEHRMSVRSSDGTMVYARGVLQVRGGEELAVQVGEGSLPETSGAGVSFVADGL